MKGFTGTSGDTIPFDDVVLNIGNAYDPMNWDFTAPVTGIYDLSYGALAGYSCSSNHMCVALQVNGLDMSISCSEVFASGGTSVTLQLQAGDSAKIIFHPAPCCILHDSGGYSYHTFSGHLVYQII